MVASTRRLPGAVTNALTLTEMGLSMGRDTILMRRIDGRMAIVEDGERCLASLSVLTKETLPAELLLDLIGAAAYLRDGDLALANLRLVFSRLPAIRTAADAERLAAAITLLNGGMTPSDLMKHVGLSADILEAVRKFDPNQPRVPAGNGRASGQWGSSSSTDARMVALSASRGFLRGASLEIVGALTRFAARFSLPTALLGALFIPTPDSGGVTEGSLPGAPDVAFKSDGPAGLLTLKTVIAGQDVTVTARNLGGVFVDVRSGQEIGRKLGGQLFLALDAVTDVFQDAHEAQDDEGTKPKAAIDDDGPRLCPAPQKDTPHGSSEDAKNYEDDVRMRVNPTAPIPREFAVRFVNPKTGDSYFFDDCFRDHGDLVDGDMKRGDFADAKSARFGFLLLNSTTRQGVLADFDRAAQRQMRAIEGTGRRIKWYFGSEYAANEVRKTIGDRYDIVLPSPTWRPESDDEPWPGFDSSAWLNVLVFWGPRVESPRQIAGRWLDLFPRLANIHPSFQNWWDMIVYTDILPLPAEVDVVKSRIVRAGNAFTPEIARSITGYRLGARNTDIAEWDSRFATVDALVGGGVDYVGRLARIHTDYGVIPDPEIFNFQSLRAMLLVLADVFNADCGLVTRNDLDNLAPNYEQGATRLTPAWLSYVAPHFAHLVAPPPTAIVESRPDGGLLMASTTDPLDVGDPKHVQAAFDIAASARALRAFGR